MSTSYTDTVSFVTLTCGACGIVFGVPGRWEHARRVAKESGGSFCCPNGHSRVFRESENEKLKKQLAAKQAYADQILADLRQKEKALAAQKGETTKARNRASKGVCPCCQRSFAAVRMAAHMKTKHPEFKP